VFIVSILQNIRSHINAKKRAAFRAAPHIWT